jgi:hypothetical protein
LYVEPSEEYEEDFAQEPSSPNERLRQAIRYLENENMHSSRPFERRLDLIERYILRKYPADGLTFSSRLYNQVKAQVEGHKAQIRGLERADAVAAHPGPLSTACDSEMSSAEEVEAHRELARSQEGFQGPSATVTTVPEKAKTPGSRLRRQQSAIPLTARGRNEDVGNRVKHWTSGDSPDSDNEPEIWHADMPALLPFGETITMAQWESNWIEEDLKKSGGGSRAAQDAAVDKAKAKATVTLMSISQGNGRADGAQGTRSSKQAEEKTTVDPPELKKHHLYDSGSRFKLPTATENLRKLQKNSDLFNLQLAIDAFNKDKSDGGTKKWWAPRSALPRVSATSASGTKRPASNSADPSASKRPRIPSSAGDKYTDE